jgi:hypothetical protein
MIRPEVSAPQVRIVDALSGNIAAPPEEFFRALAEADEVCRERDMLRELQTRVQELEAERDQLADDLIGSRQAHKITAEILYQTRIELRKYQEAAS